MRIKMVRAGLVFVVLTFVVKSLFAATDPVGAIKGDFSVSNTGAANYTIPLQVPKGVNGMSPSLSLVYSSNSGRSYIGKGWSLEGLSQINRCAADFISDGFKAGVKYDKNDRFCLDGSRLIKTSPYTYSQSPATEYRTRIESYNRIVAVGDIDGDSGNGIQVPSEFHVFRKSGIEERYIAVQPSNAASTSIWIRISQKDAFGNEIRYYYNFDGTTKNIVPTAIYYANRLITFNYKTRDSASIEYIYGEKYTNNLLLEKINISYSESFVSSAYHSGNAINLIANSSKYTPNISGVNTDRVTDYELFHEYVLSTNLLTKVDYCGWDGGVTRVCVGSTSLKYDSTIKTDLNPSYKSFPVEKIKPINTDDVRVQLGDYNNDGNQDIFQVRLWEG